MIGILGAIGLGAVGGVIGWGIMSGAAAALDSKRQKKNDEDYQNYVSNPKILIENGEIIWDSLRGCRGSATWIG